VVIDGATEGINVPGAAIELDGASAGGRADGLDVEAGNSTIRGLAINRFAFDGILLNSDGNTVQGGFIGTNWGGTVVLANGLIGISIFNHSNNLIGGTQAGDRNVISGNGGPGVDIFYGSNNTVQGNFIGTDLTGTVAIPNVADGVQIGEASNTIVGNSLT